jgi:formylglycine-generating enzyme required for sulfatase activity
VRALELPSLHLEQLAFAEDDDSLPVFSVGFDDALAYCEWAELRLPTYVEWELAARGAGGRTYPWGEGTPRRDLANFDYEDGTPLRPHAVTSLPKGAAPCGALNMVGNVYEIVRGFPRGATHQKEPLVGADEPVDGMIVRGGSFHTHNSRNQTGWAGKMVDRNGTSKAGFRVAGPR